MTNKAEVIVNRKPFIVIVLRRRMSYCAGELRIKTKKKATKTKEIRLAFVCLSGY